MEHRVFSEIKSYFIMTVGLIIYVFGWVVFMLPDGVQNVGGGVIGIAAIVEYATLKAIPADITYFIINAILIILGTLIMGRGFGLKTIFCVAVNTLLFRFMPDVLGDTFITATYLKGSNLFLNPLIAGTLSGIGIGLVFMQGGSTGGTDIVAIVWSKFKNTSPGRVFIFCDLIIIASVLLLPNRTFEHMIYGYIEMVSFSYVIDLIISGNKQSVQIMVFSSQYIQIADRIVQTMGRGVTMLDSTGWYSKKEGKVLVIMVRKNETNQVFRIIRETDHKAFISVANVMGVFGEGFEQIKTGKISWNKKDTSAKK